MNEEKTYGPLIALIVIVVLIIAGGTFALKQRADNEPLIEGRQEMSATTSDKVSDLEDELNSLELESLGSELDTVENELIGQ